ncbi:MAG: Asp-tRNA(Asn)/Glu-tRNA(Gln) amidotransferase subunit GatB [Gammaproteobacteria bacterium]|nr:Asp-tRNA(Asn)/Glu-tRNA(Gln) amidotransferase subunit GatB [Gammaproteobacteria bacterium]
MNKQWESVIGLELHVQLATRSKIFSGAANRFGAPANTQACAVDLGLPGVLPVVNEEVIRMAVMFGLAIDASIAQRSVFARKNYFYPDLPKGYQISQYELPIVSAGKVTIQVDGDARDIGITRAHLEEDAGKSVHEGFSGATGIDLNRAGSPLIEIVSEPDLRSADEAVALMKKIHALVRYLAISDGNMQEGSFRCDANVSVRPVGASRLGTRTETKNINSFRFVEQAINYEIERQIDLLEAGREVVQETRLYDPDLNETRPMRSKEEANDYRYFPDPDLPPVVIDDDYIEAIRRELPELPEQKQQRFMAQYGLSAYDSNHLVASRELADYFEAALAAAPGAAPDYAKSVANWMMGELSAMLKREPCALADSRVKPAQLAALVARIADGTVSNKLGKQIFEALWEGAGEVDEIIAQQGLKQVSDRGELSRLVDAVIAGNDAQVQQYRNAPPEKRGKMIGYFVGQVMKQSKGKANPKQVNELLSEKLG